MSLHQEKRLRLEWRLTKGTVEAVCELWSLGTRFEARLVKAGVVILREEASWEADLRRVHRGWRQDLETLGWTRELLVAKPV